MNSENIKIALQQIHMAASVRQKIKLKMAQIDALSSAAHPLHLIKWNIYIFVS